MNEKEIGSITLKQPPQYVCPVHGDISNQTLNSTLIGHEATFCLRCCVEKLKELGVSEVTEKP